MRSALYRLAARLQAAAGRYDVPQAAQHADNALQALNPIHAAAEALCCALVLLAGHHDTHGAGPRHHDR
jgi:hypothetical protein